MSSNLTPPAIMGRWRTRLARRTENPRTLVRLQPGPPYSRIGDYLLKTLSKKTYVGDPHHTPLFLLVFGFALTVFRIVPPHDI